MTDQPSNKPVSFRFLKTQHLRKNSEFQRVYKHRCSVSDSRFIIYGLENDLGHLRLGMSVSRKVGAAVQRNRIRRLLREAFRLSRHELPTGIDLVVIPRSGTPFTLDQAQQSLKSLVKSVARRLKEREKLTSSPQGTPQTSQDASKKGQPSQEVEKQSKQRQTKPGKSAGSTDSLERKP